MSYNKPAKKKQYKPRLEHDTARQVNDEEFRVNLADVLPSLKEKVHVGNGIRMHVYKELEHVGTVTEMYTHHVLCRSLSDNYNFSVTWKDIALGNAEVL